MHTIKVLGPGCPNCEKVEQIAKKVVATLRADASVEKVTDMKELTRYSILATPGLVIDENLVCAGRIPSESEVTTWLTKALTVWGTSQCCGGPRGDVVQVDLAGDGIVVGLVGLNLIFEQLYVLGRARDDSVKGELIKMVATKNYVPAKAEAGYAAGLLHEYARYCSKQNASKR